MLTNTQRVGMVRNQSYVYGDLKRDLPTPFWFQTSQHLCQSASYPLVLPQPDLSSSNPIMPSRLLCCIKLSCARSWKCAGLRVWWLKICFLNYFYTLICSIYLFLLACLSLTPNQCFLPVCLVYTHTDPVFDVSRPVWALRWLDIVLANVLKAGFCQVLMEVEKETNRLKHISKP